MTIVTSGSWLLWSLFQVIASQYFGLLWVTLAWRHKAIGDVASGAIYRYKKLEQYCKSNGITSNGKYVKVTASQGEGLYDIAKECQCVKVEVDQYVWMFKKKPIIYHLCILCRIFCFHTSVDSSRRFYHI